MPWCSLPWKQNDFPMQACAASVPHHKEIIHSLHVGWGTTEFSVPPGNVRTSTQNLTYGEITVFPNLLDFYERIIMYELFFVSHRSHTYGEITGVSQLT